jgi:hypothetical protein
MFLRRVCFCGHSSSRFSDISSHVAHSFSTRVKGVDDMSMRDGGGIARHDESFRVGRALLSARFKMFELGFPQASSPVYQDNHPTMKLAEHGRPLSLATRHIVVKYFFITSLVQDFQLSIWGLRGGKPLSCVTWSSPWLTLGRRVQCTISA